MNEINNKIAMSLLRQCAWVWEHCTRNSKEGEFKLNEIIRGMTGRKRCDSKPGIVLIDMTWCEYWGIFNNITPIEGLTFDRKEMRSTVKVGNFSCSFFLRDVLDVTENFLKRNCPSMANKAMFWCKDGERGVVLPELPNQSTKLKTTKPKAKAKVKPVPAADSLTLSEQLRQALLTRIAV